MSEKERNEWQKKERERFFSRNKEEKKRRFPLAQQVELAERCFGANGR